LYRKKSEPVLKPGGMEQTHMLIDILNDNNEAFLDT